MQVCSGAAGAGPPGWAGGGKADEIFGRGEQVGGDQRQTVAAIVAVKGARVGVADQDDADGLGAERPVPQACCFADLHGVGASVLTALRWVAVQDCDGC